MEIPKFSDFNKIKLKQIVLIFRGRFLPYFLTLVHVFKRLKTFMHIQIISRDIAMDY